MEDNNNIQQQAPQQQEKAYSFFVVPFFFEENEWEDIMRGLDKWQPATDDLYKEEDILYPYILDLFKQGNPSGKPHFDIYAFDCKDKGADSLMFAERIIGKRQVAVIAKNAASRTAPQLISFKVLKQDNFAPHLFVSPTANIGMLTFSIELLGDASVERQITLNYHLHKRNETKKYQCVCLDPDKQEDGDAADDCAAVEKLLPGLWKLSQKNTRKRQDYICWNLHDFVDCLMRTMGEPKEGEKRIRYFSRNRVHMFSFHSQQDEDDRLAPADMTVPLLRLSRCVDASYMLPFGELVAQGATLQTYENIHFSASIEGASMMCVGKKDNGAFIANIHEKFNRQYLLIYLLALMQRYTLQSIERKLTAFGAPDRQTDQELWKLIDVVCRIKTNCHYTDVSIYTHHSQFYHLCCDCLHIRDTFQEIGEKIELLKLTTDKNIQQMEKKAERQQQLLNFIVAFLTVAQVMQAVHELGNAEPGANLGWAIGAGILSIALMVAIAYFNEPIWRLFKKKSNN